jgi:hypothetical protein
MVCAGRVAFRRLRYGQASLPPPPSWSPANAPRRRRRGDGPGPAASAVLLTWAAVSWNARRHVRFSDQFWNGTTNDDEWTRRASVSYRSSEHRTHAEALPPVSPVVQLVHLIEQEQIAEEQMSCNWFQCKYFQVSCLNLTYCSVGLLRGLVLYKGVQLWQNRQPNFHRNERKFSQPKCVS